MSHFDLFDGEGLEFEHIQRFQAAAQRKRLTEQQEKSAQQLETLAQQQEKIAQGLERERKRIARLPQCPYCGGRLEGRFELCMHCRSPISWVEQIPCKPGDEVAVKRRLAEDRKRRLAEEHSKRVAAELARQKEEKEAKERQAKAEERQVQEAKEDRIFLMRAGGTVLFFVGVLCAARGMIALATSLLLLGGSLAIYSFAFTNGGELSWLGRHVITPPLQLIRVALQQLIALGNIAWKNCKAAFDSEDPQLATLQFTCPHCRGAFLVNTTMAGCQIACPTCRGAVVLPASD